jgi:hypothetical protein
VEVGGNVGFLQVSMIAWSWAKVRCPAWRHTCTRASTDGFALKIIKKGSNLGKIDAIDEHVKDVLFIFDAERRKCK